MQFVLLAVALLLGACAPTHPNIRVDLNGQPRQDDVAAVCSAHFVRQSPQWQICMQSLNRSVANLARCIRTVPLPKLQQCVRQKSPAALQASVR